MNVSFKTHFPWVDAQGEPVPTHFVQQIRNQLESGLNLAYPQHGLKKHTLRRIKNGKRRFRPGMKLVMTTGSRFKPVGFAVAEVVSTQTVKMALQPLIEHAGINLLVDIDDKTCGALMIGRLANNDGFPSSGRGPNAHFLRWFMLDLMQNGSPAEYELIHWTSMRY